MIKRTALALVACASLCLGACASTGGVSTLHADLERAEIAAELAYQAAVPAMTDAQKAVAWADLQKVRQYYNAGQPIAALVAQLKADLPKGAD